MPRMAAKQDSAVSVETTAAKLPEGVLEIDVLKPEGGRAETIEPWLLGKIERRRIPLVLARAGIDEDCMPWRPHDKRLISDNHAA